MHLVVSTVIRKSSVCENGFNLQEDDILWVICIPVSVEW
jgi:hypothetical protein